MKAEVAPSSLGPIEEERRRLQALYDVSRRLAAEHDTDHILDLIVQEATRLLDADAAGVRLLEGDQLVLRARTETATFLSARPRVPAWKGLTGSVLASGEPLMVEDLGRDGRFTIEDKRRALAHGLQGYLGVPMRLNGRSIGVLYLYTKRRASFTGEAVSLLSTFADHAALAIEKARLLAERTRLHEEAARRAAEVETLSAMGETLASTLDLGEVLEAVVDAVVRLVGTSRVVVYETDPSGDCLRVRASRGLPVAVGFPVRFGQGAAGTAAATGAPAWSEDVERHPLPGYDRVDAELGVSFGDAIRTHGYRAVLGVPIQGRSGVLGAVSVCWDTVHEPKEREIRLLTALARHAAIAMENAHHFEETRAHERRLTQIFESTSDGIALVSPSGEIRAANRRAGELLGFDAPTALGRPLTSVQEGFRDRELDGSGELELWDPRRTVKWTGAPTRDDDGSIVGFTLTFQDVTQDRLVSRMKTDFVSFAGHQLRTPLSGIKWMLELAASESDLPPAARSYVDDAGQAAERLIALVNDLLDVTRLESGTVRMSPQIVDLEATTARVVADLDGLVRAQRHRLTVAADGTATVSGDAQLLHQALLNLLSNAVKYTLPGGKIAVRIHRDGERVRWTVADTGIGIPKEAQGRLFEKFYRADNVYKLETEGAGLGLYLVRLIVERLGGALDYESAEGRGTVFTISLPAV